MNRSEEVREFYEKMPYPAPLASLDEHRALYKNPLRRRVEFHRIWPDRRPNERQDILIAGCGTSQAARYALREPDARITAIDVSDASLRHTRDLQRKHNLENLELRKLAIESVSELGRSFDLVVCTGVLHHLPDPDGGLRALREVMRPDGAMRVMVYARYGRAGIYMMQEYCRLLEIGPSAKDLRSLAQTLDALPREHPIGNVLRRAIDFRRPEAMADALLHPQDRAFSVAEMYAWLDRCGMSFGRWVEQAPYLPQCGALAKSPHAARLLSLPSRSQHAAVELFRGTMVAHSFIAFRDDCSCQMQPITFAGTSWRDYIPIALPWTVCVRERLPPGRVGVLINQSHTFTDLVLPINSFEDRLLGLIDGNRTLAQILQLAVRDSDGEGAALSFFERLWQYDQVVFDVSPTALTLGIPEARRNAEIDGALSPFGAQSPGSAQ